jgi:hypothetical protein
MSSKPTTANPTANQHFVSQVEQRLNALNPNAEPENQRIYSYTVVDPESFAVSLDSPRGSKISNNLAFRDLFSFEVAPNQALRSNLEEMFQQYESIIKIQNLGLLQKLERNQGDVKTEILELFAAKFMNFLRNPYSIKKMLDTVGGVLNYHPTDPQILASYQAILDGAKPHQKYLCDELGISSEEYKAWLQALFMTLFRPAPDVPNIMEGIIKGIFENPSVYPMVCVYRYDNAEEDKRCLISDRGYTSPIGQDPHLAFSFNLTSRAFITYLFGAIDALEPTRRVPPEWVEVFKKQPKNVRVVLFMNDFAALARYNQNVVRQSHRAVYSSSALAYGVTVQPS